jgi:hypothetical protein
MPVLSTVFARNLAITTIAFIEAECGHITSDLAMRTFSADVERFPITGLLVGYVPGDPGDHVQADTIWRKFSPTFIKSFK